MEVGRNLRGGQPSGWLSPFIFWCALPGALFWRRRVSNQSYDYLGRASSFAVRLNCNRDRDCFAGCMLVALTAPPGPLERRAPAPASCSNLQSPRDEVWYRSKRAPVHQNRSGRNGKLLRRGAQFVTVGDGCEVVARAPDGMSMAHSSAACGRNRSPRAK